MYWVFGALAGILMKCILLLADPSLHVLQTCPTYLLVQDAAASVAHHRAAVQQGVHGSKIESKVHSVCKK